MIQMLILKCNMNFLRNVLAKMYLILRARNWITMEPCVCENLFIVCLSFSNIEDFQLGVILLFSLIKFFILKIEVTHIMMWLTSEAVSCIIFVIKKYIFDEFREVLRLQCSVFPGRLTNVWRVSPTSLSFVSCRNVTCTFFFVRYQFLRN